MEKQLKLRNRILRILPRAAAAVTMTFQNPPFSPGRDHKKHHHHGGKGLSGPIVPMIPDEARRKPNGDNDQEPTSPKISCMGQIKSNKKKHAKKGSNTPSTSKDIEVKKHVSALQRMLQLHRQHHHQGAKAPKSVSGRKSDASAAQGNKDALADRAPHVSQMKQFASGRDTFADFDWKAAHQVAEEMDDCYSDEGRVESDVEEEDDVEDFRIPFSAPILLGGGGGEGGALNLKPRKEINLWKRRTMAPPRPLQLSV